MKSSNRINNNLMFRILQACGLVAICLGFASLLAWTADISLIKTSLTFLAIGAGLMVYPWQKLRQPNFPFDAQGRSFNLILILIFILFSTGVIAGGYFLYQKNKNNYKKTIEIQLSAIANQKVHELVQWRKERLGDGYVYYNNNNFSRRVKIYLKNPEDLDNRTRLKIWLEKVHTAYDYERVFLLDAHGNLLLSTPESAVPIEPHLVNDALKVMESGKVTFLDFQRDIADSNIHLEVVVPIFDEHDIHTALGVMVLRINPETYLYPFIQLWPSASTTAETILVRKEGNEVLFLNELRFQKNSALSLKLSLSRADQPAVQAVTGHTGIVEGKDYKGVPVIASIRPIPDSPWFMIARMDMEEMFSPMKERMRLIIALVGALIAVVGTGIGFIGRQHRLHILKEQYNAAEAVRAAEVSYRDTLDKMLEGCQTIGFDWRYLYVNDTVARQGRQSKEALLGHAMMECYPGIENTETYAVLKRCMEDRTSRIVENQFSYPNGESAVFQLSIQPVPDGIFILSIDITERKQAEEALKRHSDRLKNLHEMDKVILMSSESLETIIQHAIPQLRELLQCWHCSVSLFDQNKKELQTYMGEINGEPVLKKEKVLTEAVFQDFEPLNQGNMKIVEDISKVKLSPALEQRLLSYGVGSYIHFPLISAQELYGTLDIGWKDARSITPEEIQIAGEVAGQITIAIEHIRMLQETKNYTAKLENLVSERTALLEASNKELEAFTYSVSHDLRAPLRHINGFIDLLSKSFHNEVSEKSKHYMNTISDSAHKMGVLIDDLLQFSRTGRQEMQQSDLDMNVVLREALEPIKNDNLNRDIEWDIATLPHVSGDHALLRLVWSNLISNAVKFTRLKDKARIEIGVHEEEKEFIFFIRDNGAGFDMRYAQKLFGVFQRLHSSEEFEGTGIGLANVQRIILRHGGITKAESELNNGATFYFTLPKKMED